MATILVLDDDYQLTSLLRSMLQDEGHRVFGLTTSEEALDYFFTRPDLLILDMVIPRIDGPSFLRAARERGFNGPVLAISGVAEGRALAAQLNVEAFLAKPFDVDELITVVNRLIDHESQTSFASSEEQGSH